MKFIHPIGYSITTKSPFFPYLGKGTPQFVVFAPSPEDDDDDDDMSSRSTRKTIRRRKKNRKEMDEYEDDELPAHTQIKQQVSERKTTRYF